MSTQQIHNLLQSFNPIGLAEMDNVKLMNRVDTKFLLTMDQLMKALPLLVDHYNVLEIDGIRTPEYTSDYYDDEEMGFYIDHHRKKVDRFKVRYRKYVDSDLSFLEVKHKNKGRTDKQRIVVDDLPDNISDEHKEFLRNTGL